MRGKRLQYILFPIVAGIWLFAIYKYFIEKPGGKDAPAPVISQTHPDAEVSAGDKPLTFGLLGGYRDPFLGKDRYVPPPPSFASESVVSVPRIPPGQTNPKAIQEAAGPNWKRFRYLGMVQKSGAAEPFGILSIDGRAHTLSAGGSIKNVTVKSLDTDSMLIVFQNTEKKLGR